MKRYWYTTNNDGRPQHYSIGVGPYDGKFVARYNPNAGEGGTARIASPALPIRDMFDEAQADLDAWAAKKRLPVVRRWINTERGGWYVEVYHNVKCGWSHVSGSVSATPKGIERYYATPQEAQRALDEYAEAHGWTVAE